MTKVLDSAKWIWSRAEAAKDEYAEFYEEFVWNSGSTTLHVSADSDYTLFVNGKYAASGQYGDFEHYKIYDSIDITPYLTEGVNRAAILVWHFGESSSRYRPAKAGMIYEIVCGDEVLAASSENTLSRMSRAYCSGLKKVITGQLGYSYLYDATREDGWIFGHGADMQPAEVVNKNCTLYPRPILKHELRPVKVGRVIKESSKTRFLVDVGEEVVGLFTFAIESCVQQKILISYGEHIEDGGVRRLIGGRDFSFEYVAAAGHNEYTNYMLRLGCRYLEIECEQPIELSMAGVIPQVYPTKLKPFKAKDELDQRIYDVCVKTLELCMMEHYVDCPWREQCLYGFDSRNQMNCGYVAYEDGNRDYARANLLLMSKDTRDDGLLSICCPCGVDLTIPGFSLHYIMAVGEYTTNTGDLSLVRECEPKIRELLDTFTGNIRDGLAYTFAGANHWAFYDWSPCSEGHLFSSVDSITELCANALLILALDSYEATCAKAVLDFPYTGIAASLRAASYKTFFNPAVGLCSMTAGTEEYTEVSNTLAILAGIVSQEEAEYICRMIVDGKLIPCSLSMKVMKYDALLKTNADLYREVIHEEIRRDYKKMLDAGATSVWETIDGAPAFDNAGSLCHGWSSVPIIYLNK